jgi:dolichol kinase
VAPPRHALNASSLPIGSEVARKGLHLAGAALPLAYALGASRISLVAILAVASTLALLTEGARRASPAFEGRFDRLFGRLVRPHERRAITGATWLSLSCFVAVAVLSRRAAIAALWSATVGDPAATLVGRSWTIWRATPSRRSARKTIAGTLGCALASFAGVWLVAGFPPAPAAVVAIGAALAEAMPLVIDDNVRVAAAAGTIAQLLA